MFNSNQIEYLKKTIDPNLLVIVEGEKDKTALSYLGFKNILDISGKSLEKTLNLIKLKNAESAAILTDFDDEGEKYSKKLARMLQSEGINPNSSIRKKIKSVLKIRKIEELNSFKKIMEEDYYGETCSVYDKIFNRRRIFMRRSGGKARCHWRHIRSD